LTCKKEEMFSLDTWYGYATGMYDFSHNELGNPVRDLVTGTPGNYGAMVVLSYLVLLLMEQQTQ
jgi:hypothetical protein